MFHLSLIDFQRKSSNIYFINGEYGVFETNYKVKKTKNSLSDEIWPPSDLPFLEWSNCNIKRQLHRYIDIWILWLFTPTAWNIVAKEIDFFLVLTISWWLISLALQYYLLLPLGICFYLLLGGTNNFRSISLRFKQISPRE